MQQSNAQKILGILSIIVLVLGVLFAVFSVLLIVGVGLSSSNPLVQTEIKNTGISFYISLANSVINAILLIVEWYVLRAVSRDATKYRPAWVMTLVLLAFQIYNFIMSIGRGTPGNLGSIAVSLIVNLIILYLINGIRLHAKANKQVE